MWDVLHSFRFRDAVDIAVVAAVLYRVFVIFRGTRAVPMFIGLGGLLAVSVVAHRLELFSTSWIVDNFWSYWMLGLLVLFQPELRRALTQIGQSPLFQGMTRAGQEEQIHVLDHVVRAADTLASKRIGGLL